MTKQLTLIFALAPGVTAFITQPVMYQRRVAAPKPAGTAVHGGLDRMPLRWRGGGTTSVLMVAQPPGWAILSVTIVLELFATTSMKLIVPKF